jgi:hypothetical protein
MEINKMSGTKAINMSENDFPFLFASADNASVKARKTYLRWIQIQLGSLLVAAVASAFTITQKPLSIWMTIFISIVLLLSIIATWASKMQNSKNNWQHCRALAESMKRISWFYMMRANQFYNLDEANADKLFLTEINNLIKEHQEFMEEICVYQNSEIAISATMRAIRNLNAQDRNNTYVTERLKDQVSWYFKKAKSNKMTGNRGQAMIMVAQTLGIAGAIYIASNLDSKFNPEGLFVNVALIIISWMEYHRYNQLSKLYSITASKLQYMVEQARNISDDSKLSEFVTQSELEMEKEQFYWIL